MDRVHLVGLHLCSFDCAGLGRHMNTSISRRLVGRSLNMLLALLNCILECRKLMNFCILNLMMVESRWLGYVEKMEQVKQQ